MGQGLALPTPPEMALTDEDDKGTRRGATCEHDGGTRRGTWRAWPGGLVSMAMRQQALPAPPTPPEDTKTPPAAPLSPQAVIVELTLNFFRAEIDQAALFCSDVVQNVQDLSQAKALNTTGEHV